MQTIALKALAAFLILPGSFAGLIPWWIAASDRAQRPGWSIGWIFVAPGLAGLLWCVWDFLVSGKGTLAPWDPPKHLVITGLYRHTRNPMYLTITIWLAGWILVTGSPNLLIYTVILAIAFHLRVILYEEPRLARQFPEEWAAYRKTVPRWILR